MIRTYALIMLYINNLRPMFFLGQSAKQPNRVPLSPVYKTLKDIWIKLVSLVPLLK